MLQPNNIYLGDCLDVMKDMDNESVDLCITDPPYKLISGGVSGLCCHGILDPSVYNNKGKFFEVTEFENWIPYIYKILKKNSDLYIMCNDKNLQELLNTVKKNGFRLHNILVWYKGNHTPNRWYMKSCEFIVYCWKGKAKKINNMSSLQINMTKCKMGNRFHPTEKPIELISEYIANSSQINDLIFDPFIGSGTTCLAAKNLNRQFIGIEKEEKYFNIAKERLGMS